jgi:hypothetical protein
VADEHRRARLRRDRPPRGLRGLVQRGQRVLHAGAVDPLLLKAGVTFDQQEPSAKSPCTNTTFFVFGDVWALATRLSRGKAAPAATAPINVRRFIMSPIELRAISKCSALLKRRIRE